MKKVSSSYGFRMTTKPREQTEASKVEQLRARLHNNHNRKVQLHMVLMVAFVRAFQKEHKFREAHDDLRGSPKQITLQH